MSNLVVCPKAGECQQFCNHKVKHYCANNNPHIPNRVLKAKWNCPACVPVKPEVKQEASK